MSVLIESLEARSLFSAAPIPPEVAAAYSTCVADLQTLKTDAAATTAALHAQATALESDVSSAGISKENLVLGKKVLSAGTKYLATLNKSTNTFSARLTPALHKLELAEAAYDAKYNKASYHGIIASYKSLAAIDKLGTKLQTAIGNTTTVDAALNNLSTANATNTGLNTDVANSIAAVGQLATTGEGQVTTVLNDLDTFENQVTVFL